MTQDLRRITWLASYPKSGNTWVRKFLEAYVFNCTDLNNGPIKNDISPELVQATSLHELSSMSPTELLLCRPAALLNQLYVLGEKSQGIIKTHIANMGPYFVPSALTRQAAYVVRDPRDVCLSFARHMGLTIEQAAKSMLTNNAAVGKPPQHTLISSWGAHVGSWTQSEFPVVVVKYEDIHEDAPKAFAEMLTALGIKVDEQQLQWAVKECSFDTLQAKERKHGFNETFQGERFFHTGKVGRWRWETRLQPFLPQIEKAFKEPMERLGYLSKVLVAG